ncbi:uncharacterized protein LOC120908265 [Anopheles arabiensis]|uniref:uncharacterized protein LOC120908265 n=1 Tax=Anopheles arabiensis TaxID=7173 RepID=UPI001AAD93C0|nr:uncharacterized protein LOC120908265 [Anopheles arabiensis]
MNSYRRTKKEIALSQTTGSGSSELLKEVWYAYEHMSFLHETTAPRRTINTANLEGTSREPVVISTAPATAASCSSTASTTATTTATTSSTGSSSGMLEGRTASKGRKFSETTRSSQISECLTAIQSIANTATAAAPCTKARALGNFVEAQVATFEDKHPEFCAKLIRSITTVMNDRIDQFYVDQHASSMHDQQICRIKI